jgi:hypothetical protein
MVWHFIAHCTAAVEGLPALRVPRVKDPMAVMNEHYDSTVDQPAGRTEMIKNYRHYLKELYGDVSKVPDVDKILLPYNNTTFDFGTYTATYYSLA